MLTNEQLQLREKWMDALRSGKYKQGYGKLRNSEDGYCCLGVVCDILDPSGWSLTGHLDYLHQGMRNHLPEAAVEKLGLPFFDQNRLIRLNDTDKLSFEEIAEAIHLITLADMEDAD